MRKFLPLLIAGVIAGNANAGGWMNDLADGAYLHQLSIPGTHDSATGNGTTMDSFARTQELSLAEQFEAGIRAFDLRPSVDGTSLKIYHGIVATKVTFEEALSELCRLLDENPTEFVIVSMRHEDDHENDTEKGLWNGLISECLASEQFAGRFVAFNQAMTVGDTRGKILLMSRDQYAPKPIGAYITSWSHSADFAEQSRAKLVGLTGRDGCSLCGQDYFEIKNEEQMQIKLNAVKTVLDYSTTLNTASGNKWVINNSSAYYASLFATADAYRKNAEQTNKMVVEYLADESHAGPTGIMMMDFAGVDKSGIYDVCGKALTDALIANNFRYEMRGKYSSVENAVIDTADMITVDANGVVTASGHIAVYSASGVKVADGVGSVTVSTPGLYVVKTDNATAKVAVR